MSYDIVIKGALVFDGTGQNPRVEDIAVSDGKIAARGQIAAAEGETVLNGAGLWLMPGLIDIHTHYDLEVEIAPGLSESVRHGTTTVVASNCSLGLAFGNQREDGADPIVDCFARVENVPKSVLSQVADVVDWDNSADYLAHLDTLPLGPNLAPMIPHSMLRIQVMGMEQSISRQPTQAELSQMCDLLEDGMRQGYVGFSTDALPFHYLANDPNRQKKIPCQYMEYGELKTLTDIVRHYDRVWQATPPKDNPLDVLRSFALTSSRLHGGKTLKVTAVAAMELETNRSLLKLGRFMTNVLNSRFMGGNFRLQSLAAPFKTWADGPITPLSEEIIPLRRLNEPDIEDHEGRQAIYNDPAWIKSFRDMWNAGKKGFGPARVARLLKVEQYGLTRELRDMVVDQSPIPSWQGQKMSDIYGRLQVWQRSGRGALADDEKAAFETFPKPAGDDADFFLHLLRTWDTALRWYTTSANKDLATVKELSLDDRFLPGFSDAGAHLTNMAFYDVNLRAIQMAAEDGVETVAYMVRRLTRDPADFFDLDVGTLEVGAQADITVINPATLRMYDSDANVEWHYRERFEHHQLVNRSPKVVRWTIIGGKLAWDGDDVTPALGVEKMGRCLTAR
jgi:N-acyl-D-aspartate/D-glutamate deacylase